MRGIIHAFLIACFLTALTFMAGPGCSSDGAPADEISPDTALEETQDEEALTDEAQDETAPTEVASIEPAGSVSPSQRDVYYATTEDLYNAMEASEEQGAFTEIIDLFPDLPGEDTMWAAFIPSDHPDFQVFYYAFYTPDQPFHELVYGYVVKNLTTGELQGYFDGDADESFEQNNMAPSIDFRAYERLADQRQQI